MDEEAPIFKKLRLNTGESANITIKRLESTHNLMSVTDHDSLIPNTISLAQEIKEAPEEKEEAPGSSLREPDFGITEYVNPNLPGFSGILKSRWADFLVNEIDRDGNIVHLTNFDPPENDSKEEGSLKEDEKISEEKMYQKMEELIGSEATQKVKALYEDQETTISKVSTKPELDKNKRKIIHAFFANHFGKDLNTVTVDGMIQITKHTAETRKDKRNSPKENQYCQFVLYKENRDTMETINYLCKIMNARCRKFSYCGTKDIRACTAQQVTAHKISADRLIGLNSSLKRVRMGNFKYVSAPLKLGDHKGNHFVITLREVQADSEETIWKSFLSLKERGFINYFGMQRFGVSSIPTFHIGQALLHSDWKSAVDLIMKPRTGERNDINEARKHFAEHRNAREALNLMPKRYIAECKILETFDKSGNINAFVEALNSIPRNLRLMYVHSYQSYIWNKIVSERVKEFGCNGPMVGDLVLCENDIGEDEEYSQEKHSVKILKEEDLANYTIFDIVYPTPGHAVVYPDNVIFEKYKNLMVIDGLDPTRMQRNIRDYSLPGAYRKILVKPDSISCKIVKYKDPTIPLVLSDLDIIEGKSMPTYDTDGPFTAVQFSLSLPSSSYATMVIREMMKQDTSPATQRQLQVKDVSKDEVAE